ncbi:hypothetical protein TIFTF001_051925 [Ficus carica]|nr:hypothetical protein TIFTF001_051925 [Ficus carica]
MLMGSSHALLGPSS